VRAQVAVAGLALLGVALAGPAVAGSPRAGEATIDRLYAVAEVELGLRQSELGLVGARLPEVVGPAEATGRLLAVAETDFTIRQSELGLVGARLPDVASPADARLAPGDSLRPPLASVPPAASRAPMLESTH